MTHRILRGGIQIRQSKPIQLVVHHPQTEKEQLALARRVSDIHADAVIRQLRELNCPAEQKQSLLDAMIHTVKSQNKG